VIWPDRWQPKVGQRLLFGRQLGPRGLRATGLRPVNGKLWSKSVALRGSLGKSKWGLQELIGSFLRFSFGSE
jgi:hypothetical protein